ncbi:MAG: hypothetical protein R3C45_03775 [Phycisphaerales bacterium]
MSGNAHDRMIELLDEAGQAYFKTMKSGLKLQEDVTQWWTDQTRSVNGSADWMKKPKEALDQLVRQWQENAEQSLKAMEKNTQQSIELLNKAFAVGQADSVEAAQKKLNELWESSLEAMRANVQSTLQANAKVAEAWMDLVSKQTADAAAE